MRIMLLTETWQHDDYSLITSKEAPLENAVNGVCHRKVSKFNIPPTVINTETITESEAETKNGVETIVRYIRSEVPNPFIEEWNKTGSHHTTHTDNKSGRLTLHKRLQERQWFVEANDMKELLDLMEKYVLRLEAGIEHGYVDVPLVAII